MQVNRSVYQGLPLMGVLHRQGASWSQWNPPSLSKYSSLIQHHAIFSFLPITLLFQCDGLVCRDFQAQECFSVKGTAYHPGAPPPPTHPLDIPDTHLSCSLMQLKMPYTNFLTSHDFLPPRKDLQVVKGCNNTLQSSKHTTKTKSQQHAEEQHRPERWCRHLHDGLSKGNEGQARTLSRLRKKDCPM